MLFKSYLASSRAMNILGIRQKVSIRTDPSIRDHFLWIIPIGMDRNPIVRVTYHCLIWICFLPRWPWELTFRDEINQWPCFLVFVLDNRDCPWELAEAALRSKKLVGGYGLCRYPRRLGSHVMFFPPIFPAHPCLLRPPFYINTFLCSERLQISSESSRTDICL